ncbi:hypothetical protein SAMN04487947_4031 [Halogeometricum rufum]|uniref:Asparagine synthase (Glutamine-hydrolysing) n=1 Tax=Halogeometricum rufum TaxID=553469 RepID=A0A1I6J4E2_9EURY|nr:hypothetical protein [Halogeometricum rufum]SFR73853.1 hypothetical protein SAMN04487947_4031 [Halogeometricum rufum]
MTDDPIPRRQYYLTRNAVTEVPQGYRCVELDTWNVVCDDSFTVLPVLADGRRIGIVFGTVLDVESRRSGDEIRLGDDLADPIVDAFEDVLRGLLGRYVGLLDADGVHRVYPDSAAALPVVYHKDEPVVAASPLAIPSVSHARDFRADLFEAVRWPLISRGCNTWVPGKLTYYRGVERLLPNHYLDLKRWEAVRYWPRDGQRDDAANGGSADEEIQTVVETLQHLFDRIASVYRRPAMPLTAGKDSRLLLAVARELVEDGTVSLYTFGGSDYEVDPHIARRIASDHRLDWRPLRIVEATTSEQKAWLRATGCTVSSAIREIHPTLRSLDADVQIGGLGGEIARGYFWRESDRAETEIDPVELLFRFSKPPHPELISSLEAWYEGVGHLDTYTMLDLAYQEHRLGCWAGPQHLGLPPGLDYIRPLWYRPIIESMHRLPPEMRRADEFPTRIVETCWPELNDYPYNSFTDWKGYWKTARRGVKGAATTVSNPRMAAYYLSRKYVSRDGVDAVVATLRERT